MRIQNDLREEILFKITQYQETTILLRENIVDKQRVISGLLRSDIFPAENHEKLRVVIKDIHSLLEHTTFSFERLEYLQNTFLGLVNIEQNKIIKIFTVASVVFMPPTLIASMYGMNFKWMPELGFRFGYPMAVLLMVASSFITLLIFKRKKWL
jgi:magnesium transporter